MNLSQLVDPKDKKVSSSYLSKTSSGNSGKGNIKQPLKSPCGN
jgi:hypothetical protein